MSKKTLQRWNKRLNEIEWNLKDKSKIPTAIHYKINSRIEKEVINLKEKTGVGK